jgi:hypothetical protein
VNAGGDTRNPKVNYSWVHGILTARQGAAEQMNAQHKNRKGIASVLRRYTSAQDWSSKAEGSRNYYLEKTLHKKTKFIKRHTPA